MCLADGSATVVAARHRASGNEWRMAVAALGLGFAPRAVPCRTAARHVQVPRYSVSALDRITAAQCPFDSGTPHEILCKRARMHIASRVRRRAGRAHAREGAKAAREAVRAVACGRDRPYAVGTIKVRTLISAEPMQTAHSTNRIHRCVAGGTLSRARISCVSAPTHSGGMGPCPLRWLGYSGTQVVRARSATTADARSRRCSMCEPWCTACAAGGQRAPALPPADVRGPPMQIVASPGADVASFRLSTRYELQPASAKNPRSAHTKEGVAPRQVEECVRERARASVGSVWACMRGHHASGGGAELPEPSWALLRGRHRRARRSRRPQEKSAASRPSRPTRGPARSCACWCSGARSRALKRCIASGLLSLRCAPAPVP
jgi:hypothetical protein